MNVRQETFGRLKHVGNLMSNLCFNLSQPSWELTAHDRETLKSLCEQWDSITAQLWDELAKAKANGQSKGRKQRAAV